MALAGHLSLLADVVVVVAFPGAAGLVVAVAGVEREFGRREIGLCNRKWDLNQLCFNGFVLSELFVVDFSSCTINSENYGNQT